VPTIAFWKGKINPGVYPGVTSLMDWYPTLISLAGLENPGNRMLDGMDLSDVLLGNGKRQTDDFYYIGGGNIQAFRSGDYKLILPQPMKKGNFWVEDVPAHDTLLFNLKEDIGEKNDLSKTEYAKIAEMSAKIQEFRKSLENVPPGLIMNDRSAEEATNKARKTLVEQAVSQGMKPKGGI